MRILKLFKKHVLALFTAIVLIVISCNADLALPTYMSDIVDVGVQQGGIASPVPDTIRAESLDDLELFMSTKDAKAVEAVFSKADKKGIRTYKGTEEERADGGKIADIMSLPETVVLSLNQGINASSMGDMTGASTEASNGGGAQAMPTPEQMAAMTPEQLAEMQQKAAAAQNMQKQIDADGGKITMKSLRLGVEGGLIDQGKLVEGANGMADKMGSMSGSIVTQRAVTFVQDEYKAQGIDPADVQNAYLGRMATTMFGLCLVSLVATILTGAVASRTACSIARDLRRETFDKVMHFSPAEVGKFSQASLITRCTNDIQQIQMAATLFIRMCLMAPVMGIVAVMRVLANHTGLEWTIAVAIIAVSAVVGVLMGLTMPKFKKMQSFVDRVNLAARELLDGLMPIRSFNREEHELERFDKASLDLMTTQLYTNRAMSFMMPLMMLVMNCITVLIVWFGAQGVSDGVMQVGNMMAFISYTMQIVMAFMILTMVSVILPRAEVAAERVEEVITCPTSINDPASPKLPAASAPRGELTFRDVSFQYPDARADVISGVNFTTHAGQMLGIIGSTGSGKSTLVQLIPRLYDVTGGSISLDGIDVRDMTLSELHRRIGYIPQQGRLFSGTVASNLKFAGDMVSDDDMRQAARIAQAEDFIAEREGGYDSPISQGGSNVSGGQRQRLAIARALAKKPEVVVFDDSFSALDYKTDARLREELAKNVTDAALVVVAQRIATIMHADQIIVLDDGHVVGTGTHEELLRSCPAYLEIAQSQLSAEELGLTQEEIAAVMEGGEH
ncbi:ABC transporter ATP-binding protein [Collinsella sp. CLA-AA-H167]|uniref:ABC transporter ATP-binding protein n=1 Tax=Collinsella sp. CLA-AA-H167 TaxID=3136223 RepID=UPI0032BF6D1A